MSTITATDVVGAWPPRKLLTVAGLSGASYITINRIVGGARTALRGADLDFVGTTTLVMVDAELPFGVPVTYELIEAGTVQDTDGPATTVLTGGKVALSDAITGLAAEVVILAHSPLARDADGTVFVVDGINYVVSDKLAPPTASWEYYTETLTAYQNLVTLLEQCTAGIVQQRQPGGYYGVDAYLTPLDVETRRFSQDGSDPRRITAVRMVEVRKWPDTMLARGYTLQDVADAYTGQTLADFAGDYATLLLAAQGDYS